MDPTLIHAFRRPVVIASILLLLLNDHVLKQAAPSALTGKLSDFAGLFFFPLLLGALIELAAAGVRRRIPHALALAVGFTGLLFAAIKTLPVVNAGFEDLLRLLLGPTAQIVRDPTDLIALVMLVPAWKVGRQAAAAPWIPPGRLAYAALALGSLASLATSPCPPGPSITRVAAVEGQIYAGVAAYRYPNPDPQNMMIYHSITGDTWEYVSTQDPGIYDILARSTPDLPYTVCDPSVPTLCYRIDGAARVDESTDGGETWRTSWQIPPERQTFMRRMPQPACGKIPEFRTYDLALLPGGPVVAAMGNEGLVVRGVSGKWQRVGMALPNSGQLMPTPITARDLGEAFAAFKREFIYAGAASLLVYSILSIRVRRKMPRPRWALHWGWFVAPWLLAGLAVFLVAIDSLGNGSLVIPIIYFFAWVALVVMFLVLGITVLSEPRGARRSAGALALLAVFGVLTVPTLFFLLWGYGVIAPYWAAAALAVVLTGVIFAWLARRLARRLKGIESQDESPV